MISKIIFMFCTFILIPEGISKNQIHENELISIKCEENNSNEVVFYSFSPIFAAQELEFKLFDDRNVEYQIITDSGMYQKNSVESFNLAPKLNYILILELECKDQEIYQVLMKKTGNNYHMFILPPNFREGSKLKINILEKNIGAINFYKSFLGDQLISILILAGMIAISILLLLAEKQRSNHPDPKIVFKPKEIIEEQRDFEIRVKLDYFNDKLFNKDEKELNHEEENLCQICFEKNVSVMLLPCRHFFTCSKCTEIVYRRNKSCPFCRNMIKDINFQEV